MRLSSPTMTVDARCTRCRDTIHAWVSFTDETPSRTGGGTLHMRCGCNAVNDTSPCDDPRYGRGKAAFNSALISIVRHRLLDLVEG